MSFKTNLEEHYQEVEDVYKMKMEVDFETKNCKSMSKKCREKPQPCYLYKFQEFSLNLNGKKGKNTFLGEIWFHASHCDKNILEYGITLYETESFSLELDLKLKRMGKAEINLKIYDAPSNEEGHVSDLIKNSVNKKIHPFESFANYEDIVDLVDDITPDLNIVISGTITFTLKSYTTIKPKNNQKNANFKSWLCQKSFEEFEGKKNFTIICQGSEFHFNKTLLCMMSEVFEKMIQESDSKEARNNSVEIDDFSPDTIKAFQRVAFESEHVKDEDLTPDLLLFAQKYFILPLIKKCKKHLLDSLTCENIFEIITVAYLIDDNDMLKTASKFFSRNYDEIKNTEELKDFEKSNPMCMIKVLKYICCLEK